MKGYNPDGIAETEADHLGNCPVCGQLLDMRDLGQIPSSHPRCRDRDPRRHRAAKAR
jgi:hypothetical protein